MKLVILFTILATLTGCSLLGIEPKTELTHEQQVNLINSSARTATFVALVETYGDDPSKLLEKATELQSPIKEDVLPLLLDADSTFDEVTIDFLKSKIDPRYAVYLDQAIAILNIYYTVPDVGEVMSAENLELWVSLFQGISQGVDDALLTIQ